MIRRVSRMRADGFGDDPASPYLIARPISNDRHLRRFEQDFFKGHEDEFFLGGHLNIVAMRLNLDTARCRDDFDAKLVDEEANPVFDPRDEVFTCGDLRGLLGDDV